MNYEQEKTKKLKSEEFWKGVFVGFAFSLSYLLVLKLIFQ